MSTLKVDAIRHNSATSDAITTAADGTCTAKLTSVGGGGLSHRNIIINGDMRIAQRHTSSTTHPAYGVDRFRWGFGNHSAGTVTASQQSLTSSDTPYTLGFRKYTRLALGQAGTAAANTYINLTYKAEAQDVANSGWNYTSTSSYITISFWFRASTNQTFVGEFQSKDGTAQAYTFTFTASGNNTWTKITKTIPGASNVQIDNDNGGGFDFRWYAFYGTDYSTSGHVLEQWGPYSSSDIVPDMASTWLTAGASTFDVTGVQLEVGDTATSFEHRSFHDELLRCQRYYYQVGGQRNDGGPDEPYGVILPHAMNASSIRVKGVLQHPVPMRDAPTVSGGGSGTAKMQSGDNTSSSVLVYQSTWTNSNSTKFTWIDFSPNSGTISQVGYSGVLYANNDTYHLKVSAEL